MIYTSYFSKLQFLPDTTMPISICTMSPRWYKGKRAHQLVPNIDIRREFIASGDVDRYARRYNDEVLSIYNVHSMYHSLELMANGKDIVLLCYERPSDFCHRHLVADWFSRNGHPCKEWVF